MTRSEQEMYRNIERIAVALETIVIQGRDQKLDQFKKATNLIYGNDNKGRSQDNYTYPNLCQPEHNSKSVRKNGLTSFQPEIESEQDQRIYQESQAITGGEFQSWYHALTPDEQESYRRVYGH